MILIVDSLGMVGIQTVALLMARLGLFQRVAAALAPYCWLT